MLVSTEWSPALTCVQLTRCGPWQHASTVLLICALSYGKEDSARVFATIGTISSGRRGTILPLLCQIVNQAPIANEEFECAWRV